MPQRARAGHHPPAELGETGEGQSPPSREDRPRPPSSSASEDKDQTSLWTKLNSLLYNRLHILGCSPKVSPNPLSPSDRDRESDPASTAWNKAKVKFLRFFNQDECISKEHRPLHRFQPSVCVHSDIPGCSNPLTPTATALLSVAKLFSVTITW